MKKLSLLSLIIAGMAMMTLLSCSKTDTPPPNGGVTPTPTPTTPAAPYLNASLSSDTAWYKGTVTVSFSSNGTVLYNGSGEVSNPITIADITTPVAVNLTSTITDPVTGKVSPTTSWSKTIQVYSSNKTNICKDVSWMTDSTIMSNILYSPTEMPASYESISTIEDGWVMKYNTNNTLQLSNAGAHSGIHSYRFENNDTKIWFSNYTKNVESSTPTRLVLTSMVESTFNGQRVWRKWVWIYKKV